MYVCVHVRAHARTCAYVCLRVYGSWMRVSVRGRAHMFVFIAHARACFIILPACM